jgi:hypothetical protein
VRLATVAEITPYNNPPVWKQNAFSRLLPR